MPTATRALLPPRACFLWASRPGSLADPQKFLAIEAGIWSGDPNTPGDEGVLGLVKQGMFLAGSAAVQQGSARDWWRSLNDGSGYVAERL